MPAIEFSGHARDMLEERRIPEEWVDRTLQAPDGTEVGADEEEAMRLKIDRENDALYFRLDESAIVESEEVQPGVILDFDAQGKMVGIEVLNLSSRVSPDRLRIVQVETS